VDLISRIEILKFSRGQNFANRGVLKILRGQNFAKRCSFKFRGFSISRILFCWIAKQLGLNWFHFFNLQFYVRNQGTAMKC